MRIILLLCLWMGGIFASGFATSPLEGKVVAVYVSKKQFSYDENYNHLLSQFIKQDQGEETIVEDIKLESLVAMGRLFSEQLASATGADSCFFLNGNPELARSFIQKYTSEASQLAPLGGAFSGIDYVLVVNPLELTSYKASSVFTRSNRLVTVRDLVKTGRINLDLFDPSTGKLTASHQACMDERKTKVPEKYFSFYNSRSKTGKFISQLFSLVVYQMNAGLPGNCGEEG